MKIDKSTMKDWPMKLGELPRKGDKFNVQVIINEDKETWVDSETALYYLYELYLSCFCDGAIERDAGIPHWETTSDFEDFINSPE